MGTWTVEPGGELRLDDLNGIREVSIRIVGGEVAVSGGDQPPVLELSALEDSPVEVAFADGVLEVSHREAEGSGRKGFLGLLARGRAPRVSIALTVPAATTVSVATVSADAVVAGCTQTATVKSVSGDLTLKDIAASIDVKTVSGDVQAHSIAGALGFGTVSGDITVVNGSCDGLNVKTVSGDVTLGFDAIDAGDMSIATVSGDIAMRLPVGAELDLDFKTLSGSVAAPWDLDLDRGRGRTMRHTAEEAHARLSVKTVSGDLRIAHAREAVA